MSEPKRIKVEENSSAPPEIQLDGLYVQNKGKLVYITPKEGLDMIRTIEEKFAKKAITLKNMIEIAKTTDDSVPVLLDRIPAKVLDKVIEYLIYHSEDPDSHSTESEDEDYSEIPRSDVIDEWDRNLMSDLDRDTLFGLIEAANYLNIKRLVDLGCKTAANQIRGRSAEEVRELWNIKSDLTPEEEEQIRNDNPWTDDNDH